MLKTIDLVPDFKRKPGRLMDPHAQEADLEFAAVRMRVIERDKYTCRACSFNTVPDYKAPSTSLKASGYLEGHHLDDDHHNNEMNNLVSVCPLCHSVFHIGFAGHMGRCKIAWIPWLSQADLNLLVNCAAVAQARGGEKISLQAAALLGHLDRCCTIADELCPGMSSPINLVAAFTELNRKDPKVFKKRKIALKQFRVLPQETMFRDAVAWWNEHSWFLGDDWEEVWRDIYSDWEARIAGNR